MHKDSTKNLESQRDTQYSTLGSIPENQQSNHNHWTEEIKNIPQNMVHQRNADYLLQSQNKKNRLDEQRDLEMQKLFNSKAKGEQVRFMTPIGQN